MSVSLRSLKKIAELKRRLTIQAEMEYAEACRMLEEAKQSLEIAREAAQEIRQEMFALCQHGETAYKLVEWQRYLAWQESRIQMQERLLHEFRVRRDQKLSQLKSCYMEERKWERHWEQRQEERKKERQQREQKALDEIAVIRFHQARRGGDSAGIAKFL